jgi:phosphoserine phosphatase
VLRLRPAETLAVGDGANDLPMLNAAGLGVAFRPAPAVAAQAPVVVRRGDLTALLYLQGIAKREFRSG